MPKEMSLENSLVVVGDEDLVMGFQALGFNVYPVKGLQEFKAILPEIVEKRAAVCLVQENIYQAGDEEINRYKNLPQPIFIPLVKDAKTDLLDRIVRDIRLRATGAA